jgi:hypothetical protein
MSRLLITVSPNTALQRTSPAAPVPPLSFQTFGVTLRFLGALTTLAVMLAGCDSSRVADRSGGQRSGKLNTQEVAKVHVDAAGGIFLNGKAATLEDLRREFARVRTANGSVWYSRANPAGDPPPNALEVLQVVMDAKVPVRLLEKPE